MPEVASCTLLSRPNNIHTPHEKILKASPRIIQIKLKASFNKCLELSKKFFDWVEIGYKNSGPIHTDCSSLVPTAEKLLDLCRRGIYTFGAINGTIHNETVDIGYSLEFDAAEY
ncbi:hypothetical protein N7495_003923 [Penicillium taxi]|uniref:uncharacterized protein n=1 Tax=Penicillium taxi TaxID=168475 RepID=UPI002545A10A|nr:uncharacterized protein N7495_003923 [Penicillium taxi]KAJ5899179.1 hypothetical protein N7495_003923 [Penicillium taxi]